eukprot:g18745.t1
MEKTSPKFIILLLSPSSWELLMDFLNTARDLGRLAAELPRAWQMPPSPLPPLPPDEGMAAYAAQLPGKPDAWDMSKVQLRELVKKLIPESIGKEMEKQCQGIFPLKDPPKIERPGSKSLVCQDCLIRKVKILKKPKFDITKLMELHGDGGDDMGVEMMRPEAEEAMNTLTADVVAAGDED